MTLSTPSLVRFRYFRFRVENNLLSHLPMMRLSWAPWISFNVNISSFTPPLKPIKVGSRVLLIGESKITSSLSAVSAVYFRRDSFGAVALIVDFNRMKNGEIFYVRDVLLLVLCSTQYTVLQLCINHDGISLNPSLCNAPPAAAIWCRLSLIGRDHPSSALIG